MTKNSLLKKCWVNSEKRKPIIKDGFVLVVWNDKRKRVQAVNNLSVFMNEDVTKWMQIPLPE
ncbi:MAG: hypothetical protein GY870_08225 [archaeon]|nr:hypothetical protein [archaeon]